MAQAVSVLGDFVALFAVQIAVTFRMHGGASDMTRVLLAFLAPPALLGPFAGVIVDRCNGAGWSPFRIMAACDVARGLLIPFLACAGGVGQVCCVCAAIATASSFFFPAQSAATPMLVPREGLLAASGLMLQTMQVARLCAPPLAGALAAWGGERACYWADSVTFFVSAALIARLPCTLRREAPPEKGRLFQGAGFILANPRYSFVMLSMASGVFAATSFGAMIPLYVRDVLHAGPRLLGVAGSLLGAGTIVGAGAARKLNFHRFPGARLLSLGLATAGTSIAALAAIGGPAATLGCSLGVGAGVTIMLAAASALLQGQTPAPMRGRVSSAAMAMMAAAQGLALVTGGWAARWGLTRLFWMCAAALFGVAVLAAREPASGWPVEPARN
jgi:predicted MFS family arabinose efflux permease